MIVLSTDFDSLILIESPAVDEAAAVAALLLSEMLEDLEWVLSGWVLPARRVLNEADRKTYYLLTKI